MLISISQKLFLPGLTAVLVLIILYQKYAKEYLIDIDARKTKQPSVAMSAADAKDNRVSLPSGEKLGSLELCIAELKQMNVGPNKHVIFPDSCRQLELIREPKPTAKLPCQRKDRKSVGVLYVNKEPVTFEKLYNDQPYVQKGGRWTPENCTAQIKTAIVIPFRNREEHLAILLRQLFPILKKQLLAFQIFVIDQADKDEFNRGKLLNVGFAEAISKDEFTCFVFHDVDLIPEDDRIDYGCHASPQHLSVAIDKFNYQLPYKTIFGGVAMFSTSHFKSINGFSNAFWGWGAEDDNLYIRVTQAQMTLWRQSPQLARYVMLRHENNMAKANPNRMSILARSKESSSIDGLNTLKYKVLETQEYQLYTLIKVDLLKKEDKVF